jgi:hypothetical protein
VVGALLLSSGTASAANFPASCSGTTGDSGSLVSAITAANIAGGSNVVSLGRNCVYTLSAADNNWYGPNGLPAISSTLTIEGNGATIQRAADAPPFRLLFVGADPGNPSTLGYVTPGAGSLTLHSVTLIGGLAKGGNSSGGGGGAGMGGAIFSQGTVSIVASTLSGNTAQGGASTTGQAGGGGIGTNPSGSVPGGFGPGTFGGAGGGAGGNAGGGGGAGIRNTETGGSSGASPGTGGGPQTGLGGSGGSGSAGGDSSGGGGVSVGTTLTGGNGGAFGAGGASGPFLGSGGGGGGVGGGGAGGGVTGGGGGFGAGGGAASESQIGGVSTTQAGGNGGFGGGGGGSYLVNGGHVGAPGFGGGTPNATEGGSGAGMGGAVFNMQGTLTIENSTLSGNAAIGGTSTPPLADPGKGIAGGVFNLSGTVTLIGSTVAANSGDHYASQVFNLVYDGSQERHALTTLKDTIVANGSGVSGADVASDKSTFISPAQPVASSALVDAGQFDLLTTAVQTSIAAGEVGQATGTPVIADPQLGPLQSNGGPTPTMAPGAGSLTIDAGAAFGQASDQRGEPRPIDFPGVANPFGGDGSDIGAVEVQKACLGQTSPARSCAVPPSALTLRSVHQSASRWRRANRLAHISARRKQPVGTRISFVLNRQASVTFRFARLLPGRRVHGKCVAQRLSNKHKRRCTRAGRARSLRFTAHAGKTVVRFYGRLSRSKRLKLGRYRLTIVARDPGQVATSKRLTFRIVR